MPESRRFHVERYCKIIGFLLAYKLKKHSAKSINGICRIAFMIGKGSPDSMIRAMRERGPIQYKKRGSFDQAVSCVVFHDSDCPSSGHVCVPIVSRTALAAFIDAPGAPSFDRTFDKSLICFCL